MLVISDNNDFQFGVNPDRIDFIRVREVKGNHVLSIFFTFPDGKLEEITLFSGQKSQATNAYNHLRKMIEGNQNGNN